MKQYRIKQLHTILSKHSGRDMFGHISTRHQGGRHKRFYRIIDWRRDKIGIPARVVSIEYDPNRTAEIALLHYRDGEKRYIIAPEGLDVGTRVESGETADVRVGNTLPLGRMPVGTPVHNVELVPGRGGQIVRSAGSVATVLSNDGIWAQLKMPSSEIRAFRVGCRATVGQVSNPDHKNETIGKAGRSRHMGRRPTVRGVAQNPRSHPHGGGEGRSGIGLVSPKSPWGKRTLGKRTRKRRKYSDSRILERRKSR